VRMQIPGAPAVPIRYFWGEHYFHIEAVRNDIPEWLRGGMLDLSPEAQNIHTHWAYGDGSRKTDDTKQAYDHSGLMFMLDDNAYTRNNRFPYSASGDRGITELTPLYSPDGGAMFMAATCYALATGNPDGGNGRVAGRMFQHLIVPTDAPYGAEFKVPCDTNVRHWFKVLSPGNMAYYFKMACRINDPV
jgi:hypothetical protein